MFDLAKAYEVVRLELVWEHDREWGNPGRMLRLMLERIGITRHCVFKGAVAGGVDTLSASLS